MREIAQELFAVQTIKQFDDEWKEVNRRTFSYFNSEIMNMEDEDLDNFVRKTIKSLKDQQKLIGKLRSIPIEEIENELDPKVFQLLKYSKINNIYDLRRNLSRRYNGEVFSRIVGISKVKGTKILDVLDKRGFASNFYAKHWK